MRRALIVGLDDYPQSPLTGCVNDALLMNEVLATNQDGSRNYHVQLLTSSPGSALTRADLREALRTLFDSRDEAFFYFSGHGRQTAWGAEIVTLDLDGVSMEDIVTLSARSKVPEVVIILDCCFSGDTGTVHALGATAFAEGVTVLSEGVIILAAARSDQVAVEAGGQGLFTRLLIEGLQGAAADHLGKVSPLGLYDFASRAFGAWDQRPVFKGNVATPCVLRTCRPPLDSDLLRRLPHVFETEVSRLPLTPEHEGERCEGVALTTLQQQFEELKRLRNAGLLKGENDEDLYWAAIRSGAVVLTPLGRYFWRLAANGRL